MLFDDLVDVKIFNKLSSKYTNTAHAPGTITPPAHTELNYIQSSGVQWVDTGVPGQSGLCIEIKWQVLNISTSACVVGSRIASTSNTLAVTRGAKSLYSGYRTASSNIGGFDSVAINNIYTVVKDDNKTYLNGTLVKTETAATFNNNLNMALFAVNEAGTIKMFDTIKLYYCKIKLNGVLIKDFIPVNKDGVFCLYDKITQTYHLNKGTSAFTGA